MSFNEHYFDIISFCIGNQTKARQFAPYASLLSAIIKQWLLAFHEPEKLYFILRFSLLQFWLCFPLFFLHLQGTEALCVCASRSVCISSKLVRCFFFICYTPYARTVYVYVCRSSIRSDFIISWRFTYWRNAINNLCYLDIWRFINIKN